MDETHVFITTTQATPRQDRKAKHLVRRQAMKQFRDRQKSCRAQPQYDASGSTVLVKASGSATTSSADPTIYGQWPYPSTTSCTSRDKTEWTRHQPCSHPLYQDKSSRNITIRTVVNEDAIYRQQLVVPFLETHFCAAMLDTHRIAPKLAAWLQVSHGGGPLKAATDALLLQAMVTRSHYQSHTTTALHKYGQALGYIRAVLRDEGQALSPRRICELIVYVDALAIFEASRTCKQDRLALSSHRAGVMTLIAARGTDILLSKDYCLLVFDIVFQGLLSALLERTKFPFGDESWITALSSVAHTRGHNLIVIGCRLPQLLESVDKLTYTDLDEAQRLRKSLADLSVDLHAWLNEWYSEHNDDPQFPFSPVPRADYYWKAQSELMLPPFDSLLEFPSLLEAIAHTCYWTLLLSIQHTRVNLLSAKDGNGAEELQYCKESANECAAYICRTAPTLILGLSDVVDGLENVAGPLLIAEKWFQEEDNHTSAALWCKATVATVLRDGTCTPGWITRCCASWLTAVL